MYIFFKSLFISVLYLLNPSIITGYNTFDINYNNIDDVYYKQRQLSNVDNNIKIVTLFNQDLTIDMFYTTFASIVYFSSICITYSLIYCTTYRRVLKKNTRLCGYKSIGTVVFIILFSIWTILTVVYSFMTDDSGDTLFRLGIWIIINMVFILIPIPRNNMFTKFLKLSHSEIVFIHGYIAILCMLSVLIKFIVVLVYYPPEFLIILLNSKTGGSPLAGTLATFFLILTGIVGMPYIKNNFYEMFYYSHRTLTVLSFITTIWHYNISIFYLMFPTILYIYDLIMRCRYINRGMYLKLTNMGEEKNNTSYVVINIKINDFKVSAPGSYYLICFRNISYLQWHPFSLVKQNKNTLTFCAKNMGNNSWTGKLKNISDNSPENSEIYIQGPYSYFDIDYILYKYKYIFCICGGIGVTPIFSILDYITELIYLKKTDLQKVVFIWVIPHISLIEYFDILELNQKLIETEIYVTKQKIDNNYPKHIKEGRPDLKKSVEVFIKMNKINIDRLCILSAGPTSLMNSVKSIGIDYNIDNFCEEF